MRSRSPLAPSRRLVVILVAALGLLCLPRAASAAETTTVSISTPTEPIEPGQQFSVSIEVEPGAPIAGMQFDLSFDASLVAVTAVQDGDLLNQDGATNFFSPGSMDNQAGKITGVFGAITTPGMAVSRPGTFATVIFTARRQSEDCPLSLSNVVVGDKSGNAVPVSLDGEGSSGATAAERPVFQWWVLSVIVGVAVVLIAITVAGILLRRRQMVRALEAPRSPRQNGGTGVE
jgi:hypothetical protein